jgi:hypothetical protein
LCTKESGLVGGEGVDDGGLQGLEGGVASLGQAVVLDHPEDPLDGVEFGTVGWQVVEIDAPGPEVGQRRTDLLALVQPGVVEDDDEGDR